MRDEDEARRVRARARSSWPIRICTLADEAAPDVASLTPAERVAMVWAITLDAWASSGQPLPTYARGDAPGRVIRRAP